jgi:hypothetical protein
MDDETTGDLPDKEQTRASQPPAEDATGIMSGEAADVTRVVPAGAAAPPPPPPVEPTLIMTRRRGGTGKGWLWALAALVAVAVLAVAACFYYLLPLTSDETAGEVYVGSWAPLDGRGGGLVIASAGGSLRITQYDGSLEAVSSSTAVLRDGTLTARLDAAALGLDGLTGEVEATLKHVSTSDRLRLSAGEPETQALEFVRREVLLPASPTPSPVSTTTPSQSPSPTPTPSESPSPGVSPSALADQQVVAAITRIQIGIVTWAAHNDGLSPDHAEVSQTGGVARFVDPWPLNPFSGQLMVPGTDPGDYTYEQLDDGESYRLTGYLSDGSTFTAP